jgi:hypothetical protein
VLSLLSAYTYKWNGTMFCRGLLVAFLVLSTQNIAVLAQPATPVNTPIKDKWALVIGISEFEQPSLNLKYAAKDATDFRDFLVSQCHFAADHVRLLTNKQATSKRILDELGDSWLPRVAMPEDLVVVFISSHGSPSQMDVAGVNYVIAHDTNPEKLFTTGLPLQHLADTIKERIRCNRVVIVLDACHAGAATDAAKGLVRPANVDAALMAAGTGQVVICSSSKNEVSWESKQYQNSVFTHTLIEALKKNGSQTKLGDALHFMKEEVPREVQLERGVSQNPVIEASKWKGEDLILAAVPVAPRPGLPEPPTDLGTTPAAPAAVESPLMVARSKAPNTIPNVAGQWIGNDGLVYNIWQHGRDTGWDMTAIGEHARGKISEDGTKNAGYWYGPIVGRGTQTLVVDENGVATKMIAEDGSVFTRISP